VREIAREILGDTLQLNYVVDSKVQAMITMETGRPLPRAAVLPMLENVLQANGLAMIQADGVYRIMPIEEAPRAGTANVKRFGTLQPGYGIEVIPLKFVSATELQQVLQPFVPTGSVLQADTLRNVLLVSGTRQDLQGFADLVNQFDVDWLAGMSFGLFPLKIGTARGVAGDLEAIIGKDAQGPLAGVVRVVPIERLNAVLVITPQPAYLHEVRPWIDRLDFGSDETTPRLFQYFVQNSRAADLAAVLNDLLSGGGGRGLGALGRPGRGPAGRSPARAGGGAGMGAGGTGMGAGGAGLGAGGTGLGAGGTGFGTMAGPGTAPQSGMAQPPGAVAAGPGGVMQPAPPGAPGEGAPPPPGFGVDLAAGRAPPELELPQVRLVADDKNNALVIFAKPRDYRMIEAVIKRLDVVPLQVLIEATIAEVTLNDALQYGLQFFLKTGEGGNVRLSTLAGAAVQGVFPGFNYAVTGLTGSNSQMILSALSQVTNVNVISSPQILVLDHQTAYIQVGSEVPVPVQQAQSTLLAGAPIINSIQYRATGVILQVSPRVNSSGLITMEIEQEVSDVAPVTSAQLNAPTFDERRILSNVVVQTGDTIALGGLIRDTQNYNNSGIPLLMDIPFIGALFSTTTKSVARTELLVLLSPRIVRNTQDALDLSDELRSRMRAIAPLERRIR
jgi:general secretion pathway protein D